MTIIVLGVDASGKKRGYEEDDQVVGILNIIQKNPNTVVHLKEAASISGEQRYLVFSGLC